MTEDLDVVVIGGGAAGIGAARALVEASLSVLLVEARDRLGGRALTIDTGFSAPIDLGCGWLHSATRNPFVAIAKTLGFTLDRSQAPWARGACGADLSSEEHAAFSRAQEALDDRLLSIRGASEDRPVSDYFELGNRWNPLIDAVSTYYSGAEARLVSAVDLDRYDDNGVNWRVREGYGRLIAAYGEGLPARLNCAVTAIDHSGSRLRVETSLGAIESRAVVVTLPSRLLAEERIRFAPGLPEKTDAAQGLPLGVADKLYLRVENAERLDSEGRAFGRTDRAETAAYNIRPMGLPIVECYFGGTLASTLEQGGEAAFLDFARGELVGLFGSDFARRISPLPMHLWQTDPLASGSYSYASPGKADMRKVLAEPVEGRLFFAGEACSVTDFSTAHGALLSGRAAAEAVVDSLNKSSSA